MPCNVFAENLPGLGQGTDGKKLSAPGHLNRFFCSKIFLFLFSWCGSCAHCMHVNNRKEVKTRTLQQPTNGDWLLFEPK